jgi:hypothetical protein
MAALLVTLQFVSAAERINIIYKNPVLTLIGAFVVMTKYIYVFWS